MSHPFSLDGPLAGSRKAGPKYKKFKEYVLRELQAGRLRSGDALPSEKRLAESLDMARNTVRQALADLEGDGIVSRIHGKGTFISERGGEPQGRAVDIVAFVVPQTDAGHYPAMLSGFERTAAQEHRQTLVCCTENNLQIQADALLQLLERGVAGVAIVPAPSPPTPAYHLLPLVREKLPIVFCHRRVEGIRAPLVGIPYREVGELAGNALAAQGHRRVAIIGPWADCASVAYRDGLRSVMQAHGGDVLDAHVYLGHETQVENAAHEHHVREALRSIFADPNRPTAIFSTFDDLSELIFLLLREMSIRIPEDISLVGFGGRRRETPISERITSVVVDGSALGSCAATLIQEIIKGERPRDDESVMYLPASLSHGVTLGPPP